MNAGKQLAIVLLALFAFAAAVDADCIMYYNVKDWPNCPDGYEGKYNACCSVSDEAAMRYHIAEALARMQKNGK
ncbi:hypothetical protein AAVH_17304 [Aphelenchoides avenae]|nr:hypothetical protein AAVH_17304 [Aphelenchus avenae]